MYKDLTSEWKQKQQHFLQHHENCYICVYSDSLSLEYSSLNKYAGEGAHQQPSFGYYLS